MLQISGRQGNCCHVPYLIRACTEMQCNSLWYMQLNLLSNVSFNKCTSFNLLVEKKKKNSCELCDWLFSFLLCLNQSLWQLIVLWKFAIDHVKKFFIFSNSSVLTDCCINPLTLYIVPRDLKCKSTCIVLIVQVYSWSFMQKKIDFSGSWLNCSRVGLLNGKGVLKSTNSPVC